MEILLRTVVAVLVVIALTRMGGLRSFSKMSSYDFAMTVATGSLLASTILGTSRSVLLGIVALASVFLVQAAIGWARRAFKPVRKYTDNTPLLLVREGVILQENLDAAQVTREDLFGKLREANALSMAQVRAVVLETTGDISVLHGEANGTKLDPEILQGVRTTV